MEVINGEVRDESVPELSAEDAFILSNHRRRGIQKYLNSIEEGHTKRANIVNQVAAWENKKPVEALERNEVNSVRTTSHQYHLVRLEDHGLLDYDRDTKTVHKTSRTGELKPFLDGIPSEEEVFDGFDDPYGLTKNDGFETISNPRRRETLRILNNNEDLDISNLAEQMAANENGKDIQELGALERKNVYVQLYQHHLPKMDKYEVIDFEKKRGKIYRGEYFDILTPYVTVENSLNL